MESEWKLIEAMRIVCSVPKQVKGGKESDVSYEVDSHENGK